jgi:type I restriction enzyme S subunit
MPKHWESQRLKSLFHLVKRPPRDTDGIVTAFRDGQVTLRSNRREDGFTNALQEIGYQGVRAGDLVIHAMDAFAGAVGVSDSNGKSSPVYSVCTPRNGANPRYFGLAIRHMALSGFINSLAKGVRERSTEFRWADASTQRFPVPPLDEQNRIIFFLDRETAKIDALIEEQRHLIALLREKRQAIISHAVTKGLDPHVLMRDSGIEWLGEVPVMWKVTRFSRVVAIAEGQIDPREEPYASMTLIAPNHIESGTGRLIALETASEQGADSGKYVFDEGDVLYSKIRPALAKVTLAPCSGICSADMYPLKPREDMNGKYLSWLLLSPGFTAWASLESDRVAMPKINREALNSLALPLPDPDAQIKISAFLDDATLRIDQLSTIATEAIVLLKERRGALISAAVTGKIDVRGSAKVLPFPVDCTRARGLIATEIIERSAHQRTFGRVKFQKIAFLAEAHVGINELEGCYTREAAGPLDRSLIDEMESGARSIAGIEHVQPGGAGTTVSYRLGQQRGAHRQELTGWLGDERTAKLDKLIADCASLTTKQTEAIATLYGVWNDALSEGTSPTDHEIISGFLDSWHPEKRAKFRASELPEWLRWMRRHGVVPTGTGPTTTTGRLFA